MLLAILQEISQKYPKFDYIKLLTSYICHSKLNLSWTALVNVNKIIESSRRSYLSIAAIAFMVKIEKKMQEKEMQQREVSGLNLPALIRFKDNYFKMCQSILQTVDLYKEYWQELKEEKPLVKKVKALGLRITFKNDKCKKHYKQLGAVHSNHIKSLNIYGNFMILVLNEHEEGRKLMERASYVDKSTQLNK